MNPVVTQLVILVLLFMGACVFLRALLTWFSPDPRNDLYRLLLRITDPLLEPVRRVLPPIGGLDFSPMLLLVFIGLMVRVVQQAARS